MWNPEFYNQVLDFAGEAHKAQKIPGSEIPYVTHVARVASEVILAWSQSTTKFEINYAIACALLHDTIEDTSVTFDEVVQQFGEEIAHGVLALTKNETLPTKEAQMKDSLERILKQKTEVRIVKMCDRIDNLTEPPHYWDEAKKRRYQKEARLILDTLGGVNEWVEARLSQKIEAYTQYF
ncbi:MAG TPA: bifunctional (p)ppGpp synthetase/guanosine-3',5'-bis(diphosphate) 3'-pyrophosphohydrolase [Microscillaceae bacterium]|nr:bifunctional (p)ppGpp synthetase/guanosine-3',5'-bis(diphosphate) 3'-pyrophosphohydrolase [Microscillaceae bacterium]